MREMPRITSDSSSGPNHLRLREMARITSDSRNGLNRLGLLRQVIAEYVVELGDDCDGCEEQVPATAATPLWRTPTAAVS